MFRNQHDILPTIYLQLCLKIESGFVLIDILIRVPITLLYIDGSAL